MASTYRVAIGAMVGVMLGGLGAPARAEVAFERYEGARPDDADAFMTPLRDELQVLHVSAQPSHVKRAFLDPPRPAVIDPAVTSATIRDECEPGIKAYIRSDYEDAIVRLTKALNHATANPGAVVNDEKTRATLGRAEIALALSADQLGQLELATGVITDYLRSTREPVKRTMLGPPGEELFNRVKKTTDPLKRGKLVVTCSEPDAQIFVMLLGAGRGATYASDMLPGRYPVVVQVGGISRRYDVVVIADSTTELKVDWSIDSMLVVTDRWVGVESAPGNEGALVQRVAKRMNSHQPLMVLGMRHEAGYTAVFGAVYVFSDTYEGRRERRAEVHIVGAADAGKLRALAHALVNGEPSPDIVMEDYGEQAAAPQHAYVEAHQWPAYAAGVVAIAGIAFGGYLLHINGTKTCDSGALEDCPEIYASSTRGYISLGVGALAGAFAVVWYLGHRHVERPTSAAAIDVHPVPSGGVATLGWSF